MFWKYEVKTHENLWLKIIIATLGEVAIESIENIIMVKGERLGRKWIFDLWHFFWTLFAVESKNAVRTYYSSWSGLLGDDLLQLRKVQFFF